MSLQKRAAGISRAAMRIFKLMFKIGLYLLACISSSSDDGYSTNFENYWSRDVSTMIIL